MDTGIGQEQNMQKIVSFDFDKTLYDHGTGTIPASALKALDLLRENGHLIVLATGRDMDNPFSKPFLEVLRPDARVDQNGAKIIAGDELLFEHYIDKALLKRMMAYADAQGVGLGVTLGNDDYYVCPERVREAELHRWGECGRQFRDPMELLSLPVRTVSFIGSTKEAEAMEHAFPEVSLRMFSIDYGADVVEKGLSKAEGLRRLCAHYGLDVRDSFAFGDSMNDMEIIEEAAVGIAMGNARAELKAIADYITTDITEDGIWNACRHYKLI